MPPWQWAIGGGCPMSGYGTSRIPQAPFLYTRLPLTVSSRPPAITTPLPTGPASAEPEVGTFGLLLSCTRLLVNTQQELVPVGPFSLALGHLPSCGEGASSLFWLLVTNPDWLA